MKLKDLRELSSQDLLQKEKAFKKELFELNYQRKIGQVEKPSNFRALRKNIARILTILKEREINERKSSADK